MNRRDVLARTGTLALALAAGCLTNPGDEEPPDGGDTPTGTPTDSPTPSDDPGPTETPSPTETPGPSAGDPTFEILGVGPGQAENSAEVSFDDGVTVEGTIGGRNGCYTARLAEAATADGTLRVLVEAYEDRAEDEACTDALVDVEYRARFRFDGAAPSRVVVEHDSMGEVRTVADVDR